MKLIPHVEVFVARYRCISMSVHPLIGGFIALTIMLGVKLQGGRIDTRSIRRGCPRAWDTSIFRVQNSGEYNAGITERTRSFKWICTYSMPMTDDGKRGPRSSGIGTESDI